MFQHTADESDRSVLRVAVLETIFTPYRDTTLGHYVMDLIHLYIRRV